MTAMVTINNCVAFAMVFPCECHETKLPMCQGEKLVRLSIVPTVTTRCGNGGIVAVLGC